MSCFKLILCMALGFLLPCLLWAAPIAKGPVQLPVSLPVCGAEEQTSFGPADNTPLRVPFSSLDDPMGTVYLAGNTTYDYQHNGSAGKMVAMDNAGYAHLVWTKALTMDPISGPRHVYYQLWNPTTESMEFLDGAYGSGLQVDYHLRAGYVCQGALPSGTAFPAYHESVPGIVGLHASAAIDYQPRFGAFLSSQPAAFNEGGSPAQCMWPKVAVGYDSVVHMVTCETVIIPGDPQRLYYSRGIPEWDEAGGGATINWQPVAPGNLQFLLFDTTKCISQDVAASKISSRVAIVWTRPRAAMGDSASQLDNDVFYMLSEDGGLNWGPRVNLSQFTDEDTLRAYTDVSVLFDASDNLHIAFTTIGLFSGPGGWYTYQQHSMIWHWDEQHTQFSPMATGWYYGSNGQVGAWQRMCQRPSLSQDPVTLNLYSSYQRYDTSDYSAGGYLQGDAWVTVSTDHGLTWSTGRNVTDTHPALIPTPAGSCLSERDITLADHVTFTEGSGYLNLEYLMDQDAGSYPQGEGAISNNPIYYQRVSVNDIPTAPLLPWYPFHNDDEPLPVELASVSAVAEQGGIRIAWTTATENNNSHFELMRGASSAGEFTRIASVHSLGNSATRQDYSCLDENVVSGSTYYYFLADVSVNGERREHRDLMRSATALSAPLPLEYALSIYPNPFNPATTASFTIEEAGRAHLVVYDVTGRWLATLADRFFEAGTHQVRFDAGNLPAGIYFARFTSGTFRTTQKMVLLK